MSSMAHGFAQDGFGLRYLWIDLINSEHFDGFGNVTDHLADPDWIATFLRHWGLDPMLAPRAPRRELEALRATLRRCAAALSVGRRIGPADRTALNAALRAPATRRLTAAKTGYGLSLVPLDGGWGWVEAQIAASLGEMLVERRLHRLKMCPNPGCTWVFFDETKGNTRRWCNDLTCGNRARVQRFRARRSRSHKR